MQKKKPVRKIKSAKKVASPNAKASPMWKFLEQKKAHLKLLQGGKSSHPYAHHEESTMKVSLKPAEGHGRFAGPRRKAA